MKNIPSTIVIHKHVYGSDTRFSTMKGPLVNNYWENWLGVIKIGAYQTVAEHSRWSYQPVSGLCPDVDSGSDSSDDVPID